MTTPTEVTESPKRIDGAGNTARSEDQTILVLLGRYLPGYKAGGPIRSIQNLIEVLGPEFHFRVVTSDRDNGDKFSFPAIVPSRWIRVGYADVIYLPPGFLGFLGMYRLLRSVNRNTVLYLNSFCARRFSMLPILMRWLNLCQMRNLVLAPRGEFSPGALQLKPIRKRVYIKISQWIGLYKDVIWHASSDFEATDIRRQFGKSMQISVASIIPNLHQSRQVNGIIVAPDLMGAELTMQREPRIKIPGQLHTVFVSRLARMKNLAGGLKILQGVSGNVSFDIYGPLEDAGYWKECQALIATLPSNIRVRYWGEIEPARVAQVFAEHDLLLLPTLGENFGHVIAEALSSGCPVLISDRTPWRGLEAQGVGWDLPLSDLKRFREVLQQCVDMGSEEHVAMSKRAVAFGADRANSSKAIEDNRNLFRHALAPRTTYCAMARTTD